MGSHTSTTWNPSQKQTTGITYYSVVSADRSLNSRVLNYHKKGFEKSDPGGPDGGEQGPNEPLHSIAEENLGLSLSKKGGSDDGYKF
jgi:hypothetical protein